MRHLTGLVSCSAAVLALAALTGCSPSGPSAPSTSSAGTGGAGVSGASGGAAPSWAKSLGSGVTVTSPGASAAGSPGAVLTSVIAAVEAGRYAKICDYLQPSQQSKCSSALGSVQASAVATAMPTFKNLAVSYTAIDGSRALVGLTGTICSPDQKPSCVTNNDAAAIFDSGKTFAALWSESVASTSSAYSLTPMTEVNGKWYGYSSGF